MSVLNYHSEIEKYISDDMDWRYLEKNEEMFLHEVLCELVSSSDPNPYATERSDADVLLAYPFLVSFDRYEQYCLIELDDSSEKAVKSAARELYKDYLETNKEEN